VTTKSKITITSKHLPEFSSNITVDNVTYHVQTEDVGRKSCKIVTNIFLKGEVIASKKSDYSHFLKLHNPEEKIALAMEKQHKSVIDAFVAEQSKKQRAKSDFFSEVQQLLRRGNSKQALGTLREALVIFPTDPFLLSYYGCLIAIVENNTDLGIQICEDAIQSLDTSMPFGTEFFYPVFYLNLGRAYLTGGKKTDAIKAFEQGLRNDPEHKDIKWELQKLGVRKQPPVPFLKRNNPINKYIGMLFAKSPKK
jgi:tetratricopeptide (TPR) repeat protein